MKFRDGKFVRVVGSVVLWHVLVVIVFSIMYSTGAGAWVFMGINNLLAGLGFSDMFSYITSKSILWIILVAPGTFIITKMSMRYKAFSRSQKNYLLISFFSSVVVFVIVYDLLDFFSIVDQIKYLLWKQFGVPDNLYTYTNIFGPSLVKWELSAFGLFVILWLFRYFQSHPEGNICEKCGYDLRGTGVEAGCPECGWGRGVGEG